MSKRRESDEAALADRLVNYSDALVAVAFLGVSGLGVIVADPDIRCTLAGAVGPIVFGTAFNGVLFSAVILVLRRWEIDLRSEDADSTSEKVRSYSRWLHGSRLAIVWVSTLMSVVLVLASRSPECDVDAHLAGWTSIPAATTAAATLTGARCG